MNTTQWSRIARTALAAALFAAPVQAQLPTGNELLAKSLKAMGGAEVVKKHAAMHAVGEFEMAAMGIKGNLEIWSAVPDKMLSVVEIPGVGTIKQGYDGKTAWSLNPMTGPMIATGKELAQIKEQADMHSILNPEKWAKSRETLEKTTFDGKAAYKVKVTPIEGSEYFEFYDVETGHGIGSIRTIENPMGAIEQTSIILDYQNVDGQLVPMKMKQTFQGMEQVITLKKVEFVPIDPAVFEVPKEIKALSGK